MFRIVHRGVFDVGQIELVSAATVFLGLLAAGVFDENPPHRFGGGGEEMPAAVPAAGLFGIDQPEPGFMNQGSGLQCLAGLLLSQFVRRQLPQLLVHQRQELAGGVRVALVDIFQNARDFIHTR